MQRIIKALVEKGLENLQITLLTRLLNFPV